MPLFAKAYWDSHPFETGINFVGVGGSGNYLPFIRFCQSFQIPWFIFSDGEDEAIKAVESSLGKVKLEIAKCSNVKVIPDKNDFEKFLIKEGYQKEIKAGIVQCLSDTFQSPQHKDAKVKEIEGWSNDQLMDFMYKHKTGVCCDVIENIIANPDPSRRFPTTIKSLLDEISQELKIEISEKNK